MSPAAQTPTTPGSYAADVTSFLGAVADLLAILSLRNLKNDDLFVAHAMTSHETGLISTPGTPRATASPSRNVSANAPPARPPAPSIGKPRPSTACAPSPSTGAGSTPCPASPTAAGESPPPGLLRAPRIPRRPRPPARPVAGHPRPRLLLRGCLTRVEFCVDDDRDRKGTEPVVNHRPDIVPCQAPNAGGQSRQRDRRETLVRHHLRLA